LHKQEYDIEKINEIIKNPELWYKINVDDIGNLKNKYFTRNISRIIVTLFFKWNCIKIHTPSPLDFKVLLYDFIYKALKIL